MNECHFSEEAVHENEVDFVVPFCHRNYFLNDLFGRHRAILAELLVANSRLSFEKGERVKAQFWVDENVALAHADLIEKIDRFCSEYAKTIESVSAVQIVPGGEAIKNDIHIQERMLKVFNAANLDRQSYVIVLGGGAVLDAVGFACTIAHRGLRLIRIPTTTLAQTDSAVGVKNGINLFQKKNWLGAFGVPFAVFNDRQLLTTLSHDDFISGFSEAVKVALLKSPTDFRELQQNAKEIARRNPDAYWPLIVRSAEAHLAHITEGGDPFEMLEARPLDFGHWSAHKLEAMSNFTLSHGHAVAIGVALDTLYSQEVLGLSGDKVEAVLQTLTEIGFSLWHPLLEESGLLFEGLEEFRQHLGGRLTITLLKDIGKPVEVHEIDWQKMRRASEKLRGFATPYAPI